MFIGTFDSNPKDAELNRLKGRILSYNTTQKTFLVVTSLIFLLLFFVLNLSKKYYNVYSIIMICLYFLDLDCCIKKSQTFNFDPHKVIGLKLQKSIVMFFFFIN